MAARQQQHVRLIAILSFFTILGFQNCSQVEFGSIAADARKAESPNNDAGDLGDGELPDDPNIGTIIDKEIGDGARNDKRAGQQCAVEGNGTIIYDSEAEDTAAPNVVQRGVRGGQVVVDRAGSLELDDIRSGSLVVMKSEHVTVATNIHGGHNAIVGRKIESLSDMRGGLNLLNAQSIGDIENIHGGATRITAHNVGAIHNLRQGHLCLNVQQAGPITDVHGGNVSVIGRRENNMNAVIPSLTNLRGGLIVISGVDSEFVENVHGGQIVIRDSRITSLKNIRGGVVLENSSVGSIDDARGTIVSKGSTVGSVTNSSPVLIGQ